MSHYEPRYFAGFDLEVSMRQFMTRISSSLQPLRRAIELWPYVLIAISVSGLAYEFLAGTR
jgi:hypothetical protein